MKPLPITFLSDYGLTDEFVGVVRGVIERQAPGAAVIDISHGVPRQNVAAGALMLRRALPFMPIGVHLAIVDPEVGARRRAVALRCADDDQLLVGPDNGLLMPVAGDFGGVVEAVEISASAWRLEPVSATFHGRDLFAPVAARLALGAPLAEAGQPVDPGDLQRLQLTTGEVLPEGGLAARAVHVDTFGNVQLNVSHDLVPATGLELGDALRIAGQRARFVRTFADGSRGELLLYEDAARMLAVAVNGGDAGRLLSLHPGSEVRITRA
jgi:S-adenosyl-L-methionine hydrolase (adenosine-forming)